MFRSKHAAASLSVILVLLSLSPICENWKEIPKDSFPFSYYPMFSKARGETYSIYHFVGYDDQNQSYRIPYRFAGTGGFNQVRRQIKKAGRGDAAGALTQTVAENIQNAKAPYNELTSIEFIRARYRLHEYFAQGDTLPVDTLVLATIILK